MTAPHGIRLTLGVLVLAGILIPPPASGCEPIVPLYCLLSGSTLFGPVMLTKSVAWLLAAVVVKCWAFGRFEKRVPPKAAARWMLQANIVSTIPGVATAMLVSSIPLGGLILALPVMLWMGMTIHQRLAWLPPVTWRPPVPAVAGTVLFILLYVASVVLFSLGQDAQDRREYGSYWLIKFGFVALAGSTGLFISTVLEEAVIARKSRATAAVPLQFYPAVLRANYVTLIGILLVAALHALPARLRTPGFLLPGH